MSGLLFYYVGTPSVIADAMPPPSEREAFRCRKAPS